MTPTEKKLLAAVRARYALYAAGKGSWDSVSVKAADRLIAACRADVRARTKGKRK